MFKFMHKNIFVKVLYNYNTHIQHMQLVLFSISNANGKNYCIFFSVTGELINLKIVVLSPPDPFKQGVYVMYIIMTEGYSCEHIKGARSCFALLPNQKKET